MNVLPDTGDERPHPQTTVTVGSWTASIDVALAPLVEALWHLGIATRSCCQGSVRRLNLMTQPAEFFYIMFPDPTDLRRLMQLFVDTPLDPTRLRSAWRYQLYPRFRERGSTEPGEVGLHPIVFIPVEQLQQVTTTVIHAADLLPCTEAPPV